MTELAAESKNVSGEAEMQMEASGWLEKVKKVADEANAAAARKKRNG